MWTQHSEMKGGKPVLIDPASPLRVVRLIAQTSDHQAVFQGAGDDEPTVVPSHEFFMTHREAYPHEMEQGSAPDDEEGEAVFRSRRSRAAPAPT